MVKDWRRYFIIYQYMDKLPDSISENYLYLSSSRIDFIASFPIKKF